MAEVTPERPPRTDDPAAGSSPPGEAADWSPGLAGALLVVVAFYFVGLGWPPLIEPDEGRYGDVSRALLHQDSWVVPRANGTPFVDKPPLVCWLGAVSLRAFGDGELALRAVPALFGVLSAVVAAMLARAVYGARAAPLAAIVCGTSPLPLAMGRAFTLDAPLAALVSLAVCLVLRGNGALGGGSPRRWMELLGGACAGLGTLVKGPVALVLLAFGVAAAAATTRDREVRRRILSPWPFVVGAAVALPWYALVMRDHPGYAHAFFWEENLARFAGLTREHQHGPHFYLLILPAGLGPWALAGLALLAGLARGELSAAAPGRRTLLLYAGLVVLFFSASGTKVETYVLPAYPALAAVLAGELLRALDARPPVTWRGLRAAFGVMLALLGLGLLAGLAFSLVPLPASTAPELRALQASTRPWLAILPAPFLVYAAVHARRGRAAAAVSTLSFALLWLLPFGLGPVRELARNRSAEPIARAILEARALLGRPAAPVAVYAYYYRGLPFYLDEPVVLLGEKNELRNDAFAERPDLYYPDVLMPAGDGTLSREDCWTRAFLSSRRPAFVVVPDGQRRPERFLSACARAGVKANVLVHVGEDWLFEVPP